MEDLSKKIKFASDEIAIFKEALCGIVEKANKSSDKMLKISKYHFWGIIILTSVIAFAALVQAKIINLENPEKTIHYEYLGKNEKGEFHRFNRKTGEVEAKINGNWSLIVYGLEEHKK
ncbi:MAG: hypothetical protein GY931_19410 [Maribacter sp.]|nr:hypothetical protein [Maribacter sp.]